MHQLRYPLIIIALFISFLLQGGSNALAANAYYVATTGSDVQGDGSAALPWKTIGYGISQMASGDTLIVKKGLYTGLANFITGMPSGTPGSYTVVMAETPMEVRIQSTGALSSGDSDLVRIAGSYIKVDGFIFDLSGPGSLTHSFVGMISAGEGGTVDFNKITRCIFKRSDSIDNWGGLLYVGGNNNLIEDVAGVGACRYCFEQGGPGSNVKNNIYRRVVVRFDYSNSNQPKAAFATYGNDGTTDVRDHLYQNIIAVDGQMPITRDPNNDIKYGSIYNPKRSTNVRYFGSIFLNEEVAYAGMFLSDWGYGHEVRHSVVWDLPRSVSGLPAIRPNNPGAAIVDRVTLGGIPGTAPGNLVTHGVIATNSLLGVAPPSGNLLNNTPGAVIMKRYGVSGTLWGEPGYDQLTTEDLWPWPYEAKIKAVFAESNNPPSGSTPTTNNTTRGFAASGNGLYGGPITLTSYIWEYLGTPCPVSVCTTSTDTLAPSVTITGPTSASSYSASSATINLSGTASDNVGVTQVTWSNSRGGSGTASGTTAWSIAGIALQIGSNTLTVTARDAAGNTATDILTVTYN